MKTIDGMRRSGVGIQPDATVADAAAIMERAGVGVLAVIDGAEIVGIVTDRDLVRRALARRLPPDARVDAVMTTPVVTVDAAADLHDAIRTLRHHALRRLPVVRDGRFVGMVSLDDLLVEAAGKLTEVVRDLADLVHPIRVELLHPHRDSPLPAAR
jgi:CBS domain-containing protein